MNYAPDRIQSCIDHIKTSVDVDPWAMQMVEEILKKSIPQKVKIITHTDGWIWPVWYECRCPVCNAEFDNPYLNPVYCGCGQKLDWDVDNYDFVN